MPVPSPRRPTSRWRSPRTVRVIGGSAIAAAAWRLLRTIRRVRRESIDYRYRARDARLRAEWTTVPGIAGVAALVLHARLATDRTSTLPPLVFVHGYGVGSGYLVPLAARLADHAHVYVPDLPGHGSSEHDVRPLSIPELADALAAWMDGRGLRAAVLVGHSLGCQVAAEVTARRPGLVSGLVLVGPTSDPVARTPARQLARGLRSSVFDRPTYLMRAALDYVRAGARVLVTDMREMVAHRIEDVLPRVDVPVRVVRGGRDRLVPQSWAEAVARAAGAPTPAVIAGWGHAVHFDDPDAVAHVALELAGAVAAARCEVPRVT